MAASIAGASLVPRSRGDDPEPKLVMPVGAPHARVVQAQSPYVLDGPVVHRRHLREMLDAALAALVPGVSNPGEAWKSILKPEDVIGIKLNRSGQAAIGTTPAMVEALIGSIVAAGWQSERIVCIEAPDGTEELYGTTPPRRGFDSRPTDFGSGSDELASVLRQVTTLIDVPYLKTHNIAGFTGALKNLSHGLIKHPARYHRNGCSPYIADIVGAEPIRSRLRLCVMDALRVVYEGGPHATSGAISSEGALLLSLDPVAIDTVGMMLLNDTRREQGLPPLPTPTEQPGYLGVAHQHGLGIAIPHGIDVVRVNP